MSSGNDNMNDLNVDPKILNPEGAGELENGSPASAQGHHDGTGVGGDLALGGTSASINEFSTDGTMAANSDAIVPTQRAIRTYIASQIGGGASSLNVNLITAGLVVITGNTISTSNDVGIDFQSVTKFSKGISGVPIAMNYLIHS